MKLENKCAQLCNQSLNIKPRVHIKGFIEPWINNNITIIANNDSNIFHDSIICCSSDIFYYLYLSMKRYITFL
jgi:hypothetical protein